MSSSAVDWADEALVHAAWWSFGVSAASFVAAVVVGIFVFRTLKAARIQADAATQQAKAAELALEHSREEVAAHAMAARRALQDAQRSRIDDSMPAVTVRVSLLHLRVDASTADFEDAEYDVWDHTNVDPPRKSVELFQGAELRVGRDGEIDQFVRFVETISISFENHSRVPAHITMQDMPLNWLSVQDGRELLPMYLAPMESVYVYLTRHRSIHQVGETEASVGMDSLRASWAVGDVRGNALDVYVALLPTDFYRFKANGNVLAISPRPDHHLASSVVAFPSERRYLRETQSEH